MTAVVAMLFGWLALASEAGMRPLLVLEPSAENPRNSEGDIIELKDGRLCLVYTRFTGGSGDDAAADLALRTSRDGGASWSDDEIVVRHVGGPNRLKILEISTDWLAYHPLRQ